MKKVFLFNVEFRCDKIIRELLKNQLKIKVVDSFEEAEEIFVYSPNDRTKFFTNKPIHYFRIDATGISFIKPMRERENYSAEDLKISLILQAKSFLKFILRGEEFLTEEILGVELLLILGHLALKNINNTIIQALKQEFSNSELDKISKLAQEITNDKENILLEQLTKFNYINFLTKTVVPNVSKDIIKLSLKFVINEIKKSEKLNSGKSISKEEDYSCEMIIAFNKILKEKNVEEQYLLTPKNINEREEKQRKAELYADSIEEAKCQLLKRKYIGIFGATERIVILTLLYNNIQMTEDLLYQKSQLSEIIFRIKKVRAAFKEGKISEIDKNTFLLFYQVSEDKNKAISAIAELLDMSIKEASVKIHEWKNEGE